MHRPSDTNWIDQKREESEERLKKNNLIIIINEEEKQGEQRLETQVAHTNKMFR